MAGTLGNANFDVLRLYQGSSDRSPAAPEPTVGFGERFADSASTAVGGSIKLFQRLSPWMFAGRGSPLRPEDFRLQGYEQQGLIYEPGMTLEQAHQMSVSRNEALRQDDLARRSTTAGSIGGFLGSLAGGVVDPISLIPFGAPVRGASFAANLLRVGAGSAAIAAPMVAGEVAASSFEQNPMTTSDIAASIALSFAVGAVAGGLGHLSLARKMERTALPHLDTVADRIVVNEQAPPPANPVTLEHPANQPFTEGVKPTGTRFAGLTDDELIAKFIDMGNPPPGVHIIRDSFTGERVVSDAEGSILGVDSIDRSRQVHADNLALRDRIEGGFASTKRKIAKDFRANAKASADPNANNPKLLKEELRNYHQQATARINRDQILGVELRKRADQDFQNPEDGRPAQYDRIPGVLELRASAGNELKLREVSLKEFLHRTNELTVNDNFGGLGSARINATSILLERWSRLTRDQWSAAVDWHLSEGQLRRVAKELGLDVREDSTKRELGDLLADRMHDRSKLGDPVDSPVDTTPEVDDVINQLDDAAVFEAAARTKGLRHDTPQSDTLDMEMKLDQIVNPESLDTFLEGQSASMPLAELALKSEEVSKIVERSNYLKLKRAALNKAFLCMIQGA